MLKGIIALDLDGTLLNSDKQLTAGNLAALEHAAEAGYAIVPTTGRFFGAMPAVIRQLPFLRYAITINGAQVEDLQTGEVIYRAEIPWQQAMDLMSLLDTLPVIYDCYMANDAFMTESLKQYIDEFIGISHYRKMFHDLRKPVPELKAFLAEQKTDVQKVQFFMKDPQLRLRLLEDLPQRFTDICVSSSVPGNLEVNQARANKGEALLALAEHLGLKREDTIGFGDGLNDISMLQMAGIGVAMENACPEALAAADRVTRSCDEDGVAYGINQICFDE